MIYTEPTGGRDERPAINVLVPPLKCQGIKTKLVPLILTLAGPDRGGRWIEPFMGSGVVGLNARRPRTLFADKNPHLINFYLALRMRRITPENARDFLNREGGSLARNGERHYYGIRDRFNAAGDPMDFLFLSRAGFNGLIRFNRRGAFNVPFCRKPHRFAPAYVTKIVNQIARFQAAMTSKWEFIHADFEEAAANASPDDFIYCDPPYFGRHVDYFDSWSADDERRLFAALTATKARFILSTWHSNRYRENPVLGMWKQRFQIVTKEHFYHLGAKEANRNAMREALVLNFQPASRTVAPNSLLKKTGSPLQARKAARDSGQKERFFAIFD